MANHTTPDGAAKPQKIIRYGTRVIPPLGGVCGECEQSMLEVTTCKVRSFVIEGKRYQRIPYGQEAFWATLDVPEGFGPRDIPCGDCNVTFGGFHHPYCDTEQCPAHLQQLIQCHL